jgi:hypothetical protein
MNPVSHVNEPQYRRGGNPFRSPYQTPDDVLDCPSLNSSDKRSILSAWASDAWAPASLPGLRLPPGIETPMSIDDILEALRRLDGPTPPRPGGTSQRIPRRAARRIRRAQLGRCTRRFLERRFFLPPPDGDRQAAVGAGQYL